MTAPVVLGLCSFTHDSAAALIVDGRLVGFAEEERLTGDKHTAAYPEQAITWLLAEADIGPEDVSRVAYNFDGHRYLDALDTTEEHGRCVDSGDRARPRADSFRKVHSRFVQRMGYLRERFVKAEVTSVLHHRTHGLYAFASSGYDCAAVLVVDSLGEVQTTTIGSAHRTDGRGCGYEINEAIDDPASLGYAYGAVTGHLGWRRGDEEGTVMALAALGDPARFRDLMRDPIPLTDTGFALHPRWFPFRVLASGYARISPAFTTATCPARATDDPVDQVHADLAAALQERTEQVMIHLALRARRLTGRRLLVLGGGVATNCVAVGAIVNTGLFDEVHVPPAPGDSGTAIGAALAVHLDATGHLADDVTGRCHLGPAFRDLHLPPEPRPGLRAHRPAKPATFLATQLAEGRIVGLFHGALEAGPRALGNRSILASPLRPDVITRLNNRIKFREPFRPFAPAVLDSAADTYFTVRQPAPFMSIASGVTERTRQDVPAVVHRNGTARVQTVTPRDNPFLAEVLAVFAQLTGHPMLINTSLNIKGRPICGTPDMALDCLQASGLDALMMEGWWALEGLSRLPTVPCHLDFTPRNVLIGRRGITVIDFEHARYDLAARDVVRLATRTWPRRRGSRSAFLYGYGGLTDVDGLVVEHCTYLDQLTAAARAAAIELP